MNIDHEWVREHTDRYCSLRLNLTQAMVDYKTAEGFDEFNIGDEYYIDFVYPEEDGYLLSVDSEIAYLFPRDLVLEALQESQGINAYR